MCDWPNEEFWCQATFVVASLKHVNVEAILDNINTIISSTALNATSISSFVRTEWELAWIIIKQFMNRHQTISSRCISTITTSYLCTLVCTMMTDRTKFNDQKRKMLLGTCLGMVFSDARLDDPNITTAERDAYIEFLSLRFHDSNANPFDGHTRAAADAFSMIETNDVDNRVRPMLAKIMATHHTIFSKHKQFNITQSRNHALKLGGETANVFACILDIQNGTDEWNALELLGCWMQYLDDAADVHDDMRNGIETYAVKTLKCDGFLNAYWEELFAMTNETAIAVHKCISKHASTTDADIIRLGILMIGSMSFAKLYPNLQQNESKLFSNPIPVIEFYTKWREAYERTVVSTQAVLTTKAAVLGRVLSWLLGY